MHRNQFNKIMAKKEYYMEEDVLISDNQVFGDNEEHSYDVKCFDGYGIGTSNEDGTTIHLEYPTLAEVLADSDKASDVLRYRGLWDLKPSDIHYGDIMMRYGRIVTK